MVGRGSGDRLFLISIFRPKGVECRKTLCYFCILSEFQIRVEMAEYAQNQIVSLLQGFVSFRFGEQFVFRSVVGDPNPSIQPRCSRVCQIRWMQIATRVSFVC